VATIPGPKIEFVNCSGGRDQRISKLNMVTLGILAEIVSRALANSQIDWDAIEDRTRNLRSLSHWRTPGELVDIAARQYRIDKWSRENGQMCRPEVWVEKDALAGVIGGSTFVTEPSMSLTSLNDFEPTI
jgi:hypothetical protein